MASRFEKSIVVIHAHPDDTEAFCAGTLGHLKNLGYRITIATMTSGDLGGMGMGRGQTKRVRAKEAEAAAAVLGASYHSYGAHDGYLQDSPKARQWVTALVRRARAGIVMTHLPFDYHPDHRTTAAIVDAGVMVASLPNVPCGEPHLDITPLFYHTAPLGFSDPLGSPVTPPHFFIDITSTIETKMQMLAHHKSQQDLMRHMHKMDDFFGEMKKYNLDLGRRAKVKYAEVLWQHLGGGYQKEPQIQAELRKFIRLDRTPLKKT
ncbi:MAG: PIG-L family deacetylase [Spirochaetes bacterium]|nr:PIG-L family deacetylase [Spirochaetota bacterium]